MLIIARITNDIPPKVKRQCKCGKLDVTPLLLFMIDDVQGVKHAFHTLISAPERRCQTNYGTEAKRCGAIACQRLHFIAEQTHATLGDDAVEAGEMLVDGGGIGEQPIDGHPSAAIAGKTASNV